jgi:hypothetical protein
MTYWLGSIYSPGQELHFPRRLLSKCGFKGKKLVNELGNGICRVLKEGCDAALFGAVR